VIETINKRLTCLTELTEHIKTMTYDVGNPGPGLGQAQQCGGVKTVNGIPTPPSVIETINKRLTCLLSQVESIASEALEPLRQCEDVINQSLAAAKTH
jgi:hypothetical protein